MLHVRPPFSMPSTLASDHYNPNGVLPPLSQQYDSSWKRGRDSSIAIGGQTSYTLYHQWPRSEAAGLQHGLHTPPREMNGLNSNPLVGSNAEAFKHESVPVVSCNAPPNSTQQQTLDNRSDGHSQKSIKSQPFYNSYYSARQPSPRLKKEDGPLEQPTRRRSSNDANAIATHLQIPATINSSKGSLPEFAAQITCLFWFESSFTRHFTKEGRFSPIPVTPLSSEAMPTTGFRKWVATILSMTQVSQNVILLALMFIYRLKQLNPVVKGKVGSEFRLLTVALMLGNKFLDDNTYTNKTWAEVSGISVQEIHVMEVEFLSNMRYTLYASAAEWDQWHVKLREFSKYFDKASRARNEGVFRSLALPPPNFNMPPTLPSPPASQQTSPHYLSNGISNNSTLPHPLSMPPQLPPSAPSPNFPLPEVDVKPWSRKRSIDDHGVEPPAKRMSIQGLSAASSVPSTLKDTSSPLPRLPMPNLPNLSVSTPQQYVGHVPQSAHLPMPAGRAMSTVFTGQNRWPQNAILPSLQSSQFYIHQGSTNGSSSMNERPNRSSSFTHGSATPSPTSYNFPSNVHTQNGLSPSGFPAPRSSPYKPIRGVNTLLVPPPSASLNFAPPHLTYNQMHYQPLGKPISERRTGVLPHIPLPTWSDTHHMQHYSPQAQPSS